MNIQEYINSGLLDLYAADALSPSESREVELLAAKYPEIQTEINVIQDSLEGYAAAHAKQPSATLKAKILDALPEMATATKPLKVAEQPESKPKIQTLPPRSAWYASPTAIAAAMVGLATSMGLNVFLYSNWQDASSRAASLLAEKTILVENSSVQKASYTQQLASLTSPMTKTITLKGLPIAPTAKVMVYWNANDKSTLVAVQNLPAAPSDKQYQLWALMDGKPIDAGMLDTSGVANVQRLKDIANAQAFAITLEPRGGVPSPTMDQMYVMGTL